MTQFTETTIQRAPHGGGSNSYAVMARATGQDADLSFEARGLMYYLLTKPDNWRILVKDIMREGGIGRDKAYKILGELIEKRYLKHVQSSGEGGRFTKGVYYLYERPYEPHPEKPDTDLPDTVNPHLHNTDKDTVENELFAPSGDGAYEQPIEQVVEKLPDTPAPAKERKPRTPDPMFDAVAKHLFGISKVAAGDKATGGRVARVVKWVKDYGGQMDGTPAEPPDVAAFMRWFTTRNPNMQIRDVGKVAEHWTAWRQQGGRAPAPRPADAPMLEIIDQVKDDGTMEAGTRAMVARMMGFDDDN
jgi:hypothetical protein